MLAARSEASIATSDPTSSGVVKRRVAMLAAAVSRTVLASEPVAFATVSATPCAPSQRSVLTCPGETQFTRIPRAPNSCASDLLRSTTALGSAVVDRRGVGLKERVDRGDVDDRSRALLEHRRQRGTLGRWCPETP